MSHPDLPAIIAAWRNPEPGRVIGRGHPAGDFLEAYEWKLLETRTGYMRIEAGLPTRVRNPRGQLFGGFTPTYVDMIALMTVNAGGDRPDRQGQAIPHRWLATTNMRVDYFEPIVGPTFVIESELEKRRGRTCFVITKFFQDDELAAHAVTTMREVALDRPLGDA
jgi:acyl-coenzyme A thioesterase PaaI-like protein